MWFLFTCSYLSGFRSPSWMKHLITRSWSTCLCMCSALGHYLINAKLNLSFSVLILFHFSSPLLLLQTLPFTDIFMLATKAEEATCTSVTGAGWCWGRSMASAILKRMSQAASSLQASPLISAADTGPPAVLSPTRGQLGVIVTVLMTESHLGQRDSEWIKYNRDLYTDAFPAAIWLIRHTELVCTEIKVCTEGFLTS